MANWWCAYNKDYRYRPECVWRWEGHESCGWFRNGWWEKDKEEENDTRDTDRTS